MRGVAVVKCVRWCVLPAAVMYVAINRLYAAVQLGWCGRRFCCAAYLLLEYSSLISYFSWIGGGLLFSDWSNRQTDIHEFR